MTAEFIQQYFNVFGAYGLVFVFLIVHLCVGVLLPYRRGLKPIYFSLLEKVGLGFEQRLNRKSRAQVVRFMRGFFITSLLAFVALALAKLANRTEDMFYGWVMQLFLLTLFISFMNPLKVTRQAIILLKKQQTQKAAFVIQPYLQGMVETGDTHAVVRKSIELMAQSLNRFLVAPLFWFLLTGFVGLFVYATFAALDHAFGVKDEKRKYFSRMARVIDALLNFVPLWITTVLLIVAGLFVSKSNPFRALSCVLQSSYLYAPIAAIAGGLGVTLGGTVRYTLDYAEERPWIGPKKATAKLQVSDLERAAMYQYIVYVLILALNLAWMAYIV